MVAEAERTNTMQSLVERVREFSRDKPHFIGFNVSNGIVPYDVFFYGSQEAADLAYNLRINSLVKIPYDDHVAYIEETAKWLGDTLKIESREEYERKLDYSTIAIKDGGIVMQPVTEQLLSLMPYMGMRVNVQKSANGQSSNLEWPSFSKRLEDFYIDPFPGAVNEPPSRLEFFLQLLVAGVIHKPTSYHEILTGTPIPQDIIHRASFLSIYRATSPESLAITHNRAFDVTRDNLPEFLRDQYAQVVIGTVKYMEAIKELKPLLPGK